LPLVSCEVCSPGTVFVCARACFSHPVGLRTHAAWRLVGTLYNDLVFRKTCFHNLDITIFGFQDRLRYSVFRLCIACLNCILGIERLERVVEIEQCRSSVFSIQESQVFSPRLFSEAKRDRSNGFFHFITEKVEI